MSHPAAAAGAARLREWGVAPRRRGIVAGLRAVGGQRLSLIALLALTALLYLWDLGASGWANSFYSAAVEAGSRNWEAFLFGSFDSSNFITVDKPPAFLWVMDLSARVFGLNSWSILVPQALQGVAAVGLLYAAVRRAFGHAAGLIAGLVLAVTPVAALMFRYDNPDSLLVLLLVASAYALVRALEGGRTRWLILAGVLVGLGFLTKMLQAFLVLPVFAGVYLLAAPVSLRRRLVQLLAAGLAVLVSAGWWVALVTIWPASGRPYVGGSTDNSILNLIFGYNGFGRITGNETGSVVGGASAAGGSAWGPTGVLRMFTGTFGGQASWLLPAALALGAAVLWLRGRAPRLDARRASVLLWSGWLIVTTLVFSFAQGIIHPYYTVALAPAIGALTGMGAVELWRQRHRIAVRLIMAAVLAGTVVWAYALLYRSPTWLPWLRIVLLAAGLALSVSLLATPLHKGVRWPVAIAACALACALGGPIAYSLDTVATPQSGSLPSAGPAVTDASTVPGPGGFGPGGLGAGVGGTAGLPAGARLPGAAGGGPALGAPSGGAPSGGSGTASGLGFGPGGPGAGTGALTPPEGGSSGSRAAIPAGVSPGAAGGPQGGSGNGGGGLLNASTPSPALVALLGKDSSAYSWVAATVGANDAAGYQLATGDPVMAIGGFNGTDPWPTLSVFEKLVAGGRIHYFIGGGAGGVGGSAQSSAITAWVKAHFSSLTVGGITLYNLTVPLAS